MTLVVSVQGAVSGAYDTIFTEELGGIMGIGTDRTTLLMAKGSVVTQLQHFERFKDWMVPLLQSNGWY